MTKKFKLQKGAKLLPEILKKQTGVWVEMEFDAKVEKFGVTWLRVKDGMGGRGDREDWVADIPDVGISIHDYHWNGDNFGPNHGSFEGAIIAATKGALERTLGQEQEYLAKAKRKGIAAYILRRSLIKIDESHEV